MKKLLALLLAMAMVLSLAACGGGSKEPEKEAVTDATALTAEDPLVIWAWDDSFNIPAMQDAINLYAEQKGISPDCIQISYMSSGDVETALTTAATSGDYSQMPDITLLQDHDCSKYAQSYPDMFVNLNDYAIDFSQFAEYKVAYSTVGNDHFAVPFDSGCVVACYRTDVLADAGYTMDDLTGITWDEFNTIGADIYQKTGKHLLSESTDSFDTLTFMLQSAGSSMFTDDGEIDLNMDNEALVAAMTVYKQMVDSGTLELVSSWDEYIASFASKETAAGVITGCWILASIDGGNDSMNGMWSMTNMPTLSGVDGATQYSNDGGASWTVLASSNKKDVAVDLLANTFASAENAETLYGSILQDATAISTFKPALEADIYHGTLTKFGDQEIYADIAQWVSLVPTQADSMYYYEARKVMGTAQTNYIDGAALEDVLNTAVDNYVSQVG